MTNFAIKRTGLNSPTDKNKDSWFRLVKCNFNFILAQESAATGGA